MYLDVARLRLVSPIRDAGKIGAVILPRCRYYPFALQIRLYRVTTFILEFDRSFRSCRLLSGQCSPGQFLWHKPCVVAFGSLHRCS